MSTAPPDTRALLDQLDSQTLLARIAQLTGELEAVRVLHRAVVKRERAQARLTPTVKEGLRHDR